MFSKAPFTTYIRPDVLSRTEGGVPDKVIVVGQSMRTTAIITNLGGETVVTIIEGKRIDIFKKKISNEWVDYNLVVFMLERMAYSSPDMIQWLKDITIEEFDNVRLLYSLSKEE